MMKLSIKEELKKLDKSIDREGSLKIILNRLPEVKTTNTPGNKLLTYVLSYDREGEDLDPFKDVITLLLSKNGAVRQESYVASTVTYQSNYTIDTWVQIFRDFKTVLQQSFPMNFYYTICIVAFTNNELLIRHDKEREGFNHDFQGNSLEW